jgi:hypothetical protein
MVTEGTSKAMAIHPGLDEIQGEVIPVGVESQSGLAFLSHGLPLRVSVTGGSGSAHTADKSYSMGPVCL